MTKLHNGLDNDTNIAIAQELFNELENSNKIDIILLISDALSKLSSEQ